MRRASAAELGDKGYTDKALEACPTIAGGMFASEQTQNQLLYSVEPSFATSAAPSGG